jgi:hypothetical protein
VNPFQEAFEVLSKSVTAKVLKIIQDTIAATRIKMDFEEAAILWPKIQEFVKTFNRQPDINSNREDEKRMAECIIYLKEERRKKAANNDIYQLNSKVFYKTMQELGFEFNPSFRSNYPTTLSSNSTLFKAQHHYLH